MTWPNAYLRGFLIFLYFVLATVWLPHFVLNFGPVATSAKPIRDLVGLLVWGAGLAAGMWGLRMAQRRRLI